MGHRAPARLLVLALGPILAIFACGADPSEVTVAADRCDVSPSCPVLLAPPAIESTPAWRSIAPRLADPTPDDLLEIDLTVARMIDPSSDVSGAREVLRAMVAELRVTTARRCDVRCRVQAIGHALFEVRGFASVGDPDSLYDDVRRDLLPQVIATKRGYCVGLSHLFLHVALALGLDATIVPWRQHEVVRVRDERGRPIDVDSTRRGAPPRAQVACAGAAPVFGRGLTRRAIAARTVALLGLARASSALRWLDEAARLDDTDPDLFNNRGTHRQRVGDLTGALEDYRRASSLDPCTAVYATNEANALWALGRFDEARARLSAAAQTVAPGALMLVEVRRAVMAFDEGRDGDADAIFTAALMRWMGAPAILEARASVRMAQGRLDDAQRDLTAALALDESPGTLGQSIVVALERGDVALAAQRLATLELRSPVEGATYLHRSMVAVAQGKDAVAAHYASRCLAASGRRCVRGMLVLAEVARLRGREACARRFAEAWLECPRLVADRRQRALDERVRARFGLARR